MVVWRSRPSQVERKRMLRQRTGRSRSGKYKENLNRTRKRSPSNQLHRLCPRMQREWAQGVSHWVARREIERINLYLCRKFGIIKVNSSEEWKEGMGEWRDKALLAKSWKWMCSSKRKSSFRKRFQRKTKSEKIKKLSNTRLSTSTFDHLRSNARRYRERDEVQKSNRQIKETNEDSLLLIEKFVASPKTKELSDAHTIHVLKSGQQHGPFALQKLQELVNQRIFSEADFAFFDGCHTWVGLSEVPELVIPATSEPSLEIESKQTSTLIREFDQHTEDEETENRSSPFLRSTIAFLLFLAFLLCLIFLSPEKSLWNLSSFWGLLEDYSTTMDDKNTTHSLTANLLNRSTSAQLKAHNTFASFIALDDDFLATHDRTGNGLVRMWKISEDGSLSRFRSLNSPHKVHDKPTFGDSIVMDGNFLGIGSGNTWVNKPHDGRFYIYDLAKGKKISDFNPSPHSAQYFGHKSTFSDGVLLSAEDGNSDWKTDVAFTFYSINGLSHRKIHRYVHQGSFSNTGGIASAGNLFVTSLKEAGKKQRLFVWKVGRDTSGHPNSIKKIGSLTKAGRNQLIGRIATNGKFVAIGIPGSTVNGLASGSVTLLMIETNGTIKDLGSLTPPNAKAKMRFGSSVAFVKDVLLVGSSHEVTEQEGRGKIYAYYPKEDMLPINPSSFHPIESKTGETFGSFIAFSNNRVAVAAGNSVIYIYELKFDGS